jgi:hypothetical protein
MSMKKAPQNSGAAFPVKILNAGFLVSFNVVECFIKYFSLFRALMPHPNVSTDRDMPVL